MSCILCPHFLNIFNSRSHHVSLKEARGQMAGRIPISYEGSNGGSPGVFTDIACTYQIHEQYPKLLKTFTINQVLTVLGNLCLHSRLRQKRFNFLKVDIFENCFTVQFILTAQRSIYIKYVNMQENINAVIAKSIIFVRFSWIINGKLF